jgi:hypothetical protein
MGIMLSSKGLPLVTSAGLIASGARPGSDLTQPPSQPGPTPQPGPVDLGEPVSRFTCRGVTVSLSVPLPVYYSATGDPVIIADRASSITAMTPESAVMGGWQANGAMINPVDPDNSIGQGFDALMATTGTGSSSAYAYHPELNVDPAVNGAIAISPGDAFTIVKSVRRTDITLQSSTWKMVEQYVPITVMPSAPAQGGTWFRPSVSNPAKTWEHRVEDMDLGVFRDLPAPAGLDSAATCLAEIKAQKTLTVPIWRRPGEKGRRSQLAFEAGASGYSRDYGRRRGEYALALHIDPAGDQKAIDARRELAIILAQWGIDMDGAAIAGETMSAGAGQFYGYIEFPYIAAFLFRDAAMLARTRAIASNPIGQCFWVTAREVGFPVSWDVGSIGGNLKRVGETYQRGDVDVPEWTHTGWQDYAQNPANLVGYITRANASLYGAYRDTNFTGQILELMPVALLRRGPNGETGDEAVRNGPYGPSNIWSAAIAYMDRSMTFTPWSQHGENGHSDTARAVYDGWRAHVAQPAWTGRPDVSSNILAKEFSSGTGAGEIRYDLTPFRYSTLPVIDREVAVSQDNLQFIDDSLIAGDDPGTKPAGTLTNLRPGTAHYCRWRQKNGAGWSRWSSTWVMELNGSSPYNQVRGLVTTAGTASGPLTNAVAPAVLHQPYSGNEMPYYEPVADGAGALTLHAGMGYWTGGTGALSATYQWQRDTGAGFANIPGATGQSLARGTQDSGCRIRCAVTVRDSASVPASVVAYSNAVGIPPQSAATSAPGTVIDIDFSAASPFNWPAFWAALEAAEAASASIDLVHLESVQMDPAMTRGALRIRKTGSHPKLDVEITASAPDGTYNWEAEIGGGYFPASANDTMDADIRFRLLDGAGNIRGDASVVVGRADAPTMVAAAGRFTVGGADRSIRLFVQMPISAGGIGGVLGGAILSKLKIWQG